MNTATDKKPTIAVDKKAEGPDTAAPSADVTNSSGAARSNKTAADELREALKAIDAERTELVKNTIENIKPGKPLDLSVVREINKLETKKNRLIVARFSSMLKKNPAEVQAIIHQIIEF